MTTTLTKIRQWVEKGNRLNVDGIAEFCDEVTTELQRENSELWEEILASNSLAGARGIEIAVQDAEIARLREALGHIAELEYGDSARELALAALEHGPEGVGRAEYVNGCPHCESVGLRSKVGEL
jgi:polyhydroxyalkanoate synthesis regulator phasin